ncbi:MAG: dethiobiotin synthase [Bacteroidota bacterium]
MHQYFVTGIGTEVGKTVCSAILVKALKANYWKPVQAGDLHDTDTMKVARWTGQQPTDTAIHSEGYRLKTPMSPHAAAAIDGVSVSVKDFTLPATNRPLIVEGAGGLLVPLNEEETILDLMAHLQLPAILVSRNYLGSINHTLLSIAQLQQRNIPIAGIIFNGESVPSTESIITQMSGLPVILRVPELSEVSLVTIEKMAKMVVL